MNPNLINFYRNLGPDSEGRFIHDILQQDDEWWDGCHDHIQWVFPLNDASLFNRNAPILDNDTIKIFQQDKVIHAQATAAVLRYMRFLGFTVGHNGHSFEFDDSEETVEKFSIWVRKADHNHLRITRMLKFLKLIKLDHLADKVFEALSAVKEDFGHLIPDQTFGYWQRAKDGIPDPQKYYFAGKMKGQPEGTKVTQKKPWDSRGWNPETDPTY